MALVLGTLGATLRTDELKEITWRSEMKKRCVYPVTSPVAFTDTCSHIRPLEDIDPRQSFSTFAQRAGLLPAPVKAEKS